LIAKSIPLVGSTEADEAPILASRGGKETMKISFTTIGKSLLLFTLIILASASITEVQAKSDNGISSASANISCVYGPDGDRCLDFRPNMFFWVGVPPGATVRVDLTFEARNEMAVSIVHHASRQQIWVGGSFQRETSTVLPQNRGTAVEYYMVFGWNKNTPPDWRQPWYQSPGMVLSQYGPRLAIGFEGGIDGDFNDVIAWVHH
jgi:hypothetical protein